VYDLEDLRFPSCFRLRSLIHGDLHARNVLVYDGRTWVIDFARATVGNPLEDFVRLELSIKFALGRRAEVLRTIDDVLDAREPADVVRLHAEGSAADLDAPAVACAEIRRQSQRGTLAWSGLVKAYYAALFFECLRQLRYSGSRDEADACLDAAGRYFDVAGGVVVPPVIRQR
jgi:aminoglycoside phosphotransferase (APT) family kinase protein